MPRVIITIPEKKSQPYRFTLDRKVVLMGRGVDNDIVIDSGSVSVQHAEMKRVEGGFQIEDLGSTNGLKCNGKRQMKFMLTNGIKIYFGDVEFDFSLSEEELAELAKEKPPEETPTESKQATAPATEKAPAKENKVEAEEEVAESKPQRKRSEKQKVTATQVSSPSALGSVVMLVLFLILAGSAFYAGAHIRHKRDTGEPLLKAIVNKGDPAREKKSKDIEEKPAE